MRQGGRRIAHTYRGNRENLRADCVSGTKQTSGKGVIVTNEQIKALAAVRAAFVAAETAGLTEAEICEAVVTGLVHLEVKGGRPPGNYNPMPDGPDKQKDRAQHG